MIAAIHRLKMTLLPALKALVMPGRYVSTVTRFPPDSPLAVMDVVIGSIYVFAPKGRTSSDTFAIAKEILPMRVWGACFLVIGFSLAVAIATRNERAITVVRVFGPALFVMWVVLYFLAALNSSVAAIGGIPVYLFLAFRHYFAPVQRVVPPEIPQFETVAHAEQWLREQFGDR